MIYNLATQAYNAGSTMGNSGLNYLTNNPAQIFTSMAGIALLSGPGGNNRYLTRSDKMLAISNIVETLLLPSIISYWDNIDFYGDVEGAEKKFNKFTLLTITMIAASVFHVGAICCNAYNNPMKAGNISRIVSLTPLLALLPCLNQIKYAKQVVVYGLAMSALLNVATDSVIKFKNCLIKLDTNDREALPAGIIHAFNIYSQVNITFRIARFGTHSKSKIESLANGKTDPKMPQSAADLLEVNKELNACKSDPANCVDLCNAVNKKYRKYASLVHPDKNSGMVAKRAFHILGVCKKTLLDLAGCSAVATLEQFTDAMGKKNNFSVKVDSAHSTGNFSNLSEYFRYDIVLKTVDNLIKNHGVDDLGADFESVIEVKKPKILPFRGIENRVAVVNFEPDLQVFEYDFDAYEYGVVDKVKDKAESFFRALFQTTSMRVYSFFNSFFQS